MTSLTATKHLLRKLTSTSNHLGGSSRAAVTGSSRSLASLASINPRSTTTANENEISSNIMEYYISAPCTALGVIHVNELLGGQLLRGSSSSSSSGTSTIHHKEDNLSNNSSLSSFASPPQESGDFVSSAQTAIGVVHKREFLGDDNIATENNRTEEEYLSKTTENGRMMMIDAPETALGAVHVGEFESQQQQQQQQQQHDEESIVTYESSKSLFFSPETATGSISVTEMLDDTMKMALMEQQAARDRLPKTVSEALGDTRPIVVTTTKAPYQVYDVNKAWEGLCGYTREEALHKNIGDLLQGPETDTNVTADMIRYLNQVGFSEVTLTNYTKNGQSFENHIQVGIIHDNNNNQDYFVGVLHDISSRGHDDAGKKKASTM